MMVSPDHLVDPTGPGPKKQFHDRVDSDEEKKQRRNAQLRQHFKQKKDKINQS